MRFVLMTFAAFLFFYYALPFVVTLCAALYHAFAGG